MVDANDYIENETDEVIESWGLPVNNRGHVPFYRMLYYPDVYDLRRCGYELERFVDLFDLLENARVSHARVVHKLLHTDSSTIWDVEVARQYEFAVWQSLHRYGLADVPPILRKMLGQAFPGDAITHYAEDLITIFFWALLAMLARDYAWQAPELEKYAEYLEFPLKAAFGIEALLIAA